MLLFLMCIENVEDRTKLEEIYVKYHRTMYFIAHDILRDPHTAQDAVQTAILKVVNYLDRIKDIDCNKTKHLIVTIVKSTSIDLYRKRKKETNLHSDFVNELTDYKASNIEDLIIKTSEVHELLSKLIKINPDYADILTLKFYHDFNDKEIAQLLNISHENARVRLFRAKAALKKIIGSERSKDLEVKGMSENEGSY